MKIVAILLLLIILELINCRNETTQTDLKTDQYQILTICDTLPTILKCKTNQHYLILHKILYGINRDNRCSIVNNIGNCLTTQSKDESNCTGSNICIFYPIIKQVTNCQNVSSNLTQIYLTCVNLTNLKKYLTKQRYSKFNGQLKMSKLDPHKNNSLIRNQTFLSFNSNAKNLNSLFLYNDLDKNHDSIIVLSIMMFCSFLGIILFSLGFFRIKIRQLLENSPCSISSQFHQNDSNFDQEQSSNSFYTKNTETNKYLDAEEKKFDFNSINLNVTLEEKIEKPVIQKNIDMNTESICSDEKINKLDEKINESTINLHLNEYYEYDDFISNYFKSTKYSNKSLAHISNNNVYNLGHSKYVHVLYDIPEEECLEKDENFVEILKI